MDTSRVSFGELVAAVGGIVLFFSLFLDWYAGANAWELFNLVDIWLLLIVIAAIALAAAQATQTDLGVPSGLVAVLGGIALVITLTLLFEGDDRGLGLFLALLAAIGIAYGGYTAMTERQRGVGPPTGRRGAGTRPSAPPGAGAPPPPRGAPPQGGGPTPPGGRAGGPSPPGGGRPPTA